MRRTRSNKVKTPGRPIARARFAQYVPSGLIGASFLLFVLTSWSSDNFDTLRGGVSNLFLPALQAVTQPIQNAANKAAEISGLTQLQAENVSLKQENQRLSAWYQVAQQLKSDNESLRQMMNLKLPESYDFITARTITDPKKTYVHSILVSAGLEQGVKKGQAVIGRHGVIGRVIEVADHASRVLLLSDINARIPVTIGDKQTPSILAGDNSEKLQLLHTPRGEMLSDGDAVVTSGHGGVIPSGLLVGHINVLEDGAAHIDVSYGLKDIEYVRIVNKYMDPALKASLDKLNQ